MQKQHKITHFLKNSMVLVIIVCIAVFTFLTLYINKQSDNTINEVGGTYMASMNERISKHFSTMIDLRLTQLDTLVETIPTKTREDSAEIRDWLKYNGQIRGLEALAYCFEDGTFETIYGTQVDSIDSEKFLETMQNGERTVSVGVEPDGERSAIIGVPFEIEMQDGRKSIAIVGKMPIEYISETLSLDDDDALMYSFVIRKDGSFVVRSMGASRDTYFDRVNALYDEVNGKSSVDQFISELREAMENGTDYSALLKIGGERRQLYCSALPASEWYLITILPYGTLDEAVEKQSQQSLLVLSLIHI